LVAICIERSLDMLVGVLGILKAGGAYVPIDPTYPEERIEFVLEDSAVDIVLSDMETMAELPLDEQQQFYLDSDFREQMLGSQPDDNPQLELNDDNLAYVIYTSGSTGQPKGVCVPHRGVVRLVHDTDFVELNNDTHMLQMAPLGFDAATFEIWGPLLNGGQLTLYPQGPMDVLALSRFIRAQNINTLWLTSALFDQWIIEQEGPSGLRQLLVGGDVVSPNSVAQLYAMDDQVQIINGYGPTEGTTFTCCYAIPRTIAEGQSIPIGKGIRHTQVYVLDEGQLVVPYGVPGELYIGGAGLARGYLNQDELTEAAFITHSLVKNQRLYRTGDLVRWLPDGQLEFIGRVDHQVKIRGFRIELGEIETRINQNHELNEAVVVVLSDDNGEKQLVAYVTFAVDEEDEYDEDEDEEKEEQRATIERIKTGLKSALPDYMVPAIFVILEKMPLTNNGKIDRKALPAPGEEDRQKQEYVAPTGELQQALCQMWQEVLSLQQVGVEDDFFELGGHSLLATRVVSRIRQEMAVEIPLRILFEQPTITALAQEIETLESASVLPPIEKIGADEDKLLSYSQQRLWFIDQLEGGSSQYNMPVAFKMDGELSEQAVRQAFEQILLRHEVIRTRLISEQGLVVQQVQQQYELPLSMVDLTDLSEDEQAQRIQQMGKEDAALVFDLSKDILLRVTLLKLSEQKHVMLFNMHHIASDGWSMALLVNEFSQLYSAFREGRDNPLEPLSVQYVDYANWQRKCFEGELLEQQLGYWTEQLAGIPAIHSLPLDKPRPAQQSFNGKISQYKIEAPLTKQLNALCKQQGVTLFMLLQTAFSVLLGRYSNEQDIVLGSPIAGRVHQDVEPLIGFFLNTLALRTNLEDNPGFSDLLQTNKKMILDAYSHQIVPFDMLVEALKPPRSLSHSPVFQVMFVLQNNEQNELELSGLTLTPVTQQSNIVKFDLELSVTETDGILNTVWLYNNDLFFADTITQMAQSFEVLLEGIVKTPAQSVATLPLLTATQTDQLRVEVSKTQYPQNTLLHELFEAQVNRNPDALAVVFEGESLSYGALNEAANRLAYHLVEQGVEADSLVGICVTRSLDMAIAIMATLKAGGAYVPLDPAYP
ncbi:MAG: amino acid adenylation domain-containing protein, partial [Psychrosphaera sp.]|nr:amino acid adenylation domain-containing protein [Psychrosphaera sp.]